MKIAFVIHGIYEYASGCTEAVGGLERDQWLLARALVAAGWSATVAVRGRLKPGEQRIIDGVKYLGISSAHVLWAWHKFLSSERPDWLFWESASHLWGPLVRIAKLSGVRTIFHVAFDSDVWPSRALTFSQRRRWWPLYAWGLFKTDKIFVQHTGQLANLVPRLRSKAYVLPKVCLLSKNGWDAPIVKEQTTRSEYVAWVAMLRQPKRPDLLVEIAKKMPNTRFVVCGGPSTHRTPPGYGERIIADLHGLRNVDYLGQVAPEKAAQVIADAAILLSTSDQEGFPNTFTQAWSAGTPIVSLRIDPDRIIERVGLGAVSGDIEQATSDINALMDSPLRRDEIAIRARQFIIENCSAESVVTLFERALQGVRQ